MFEEFDFVDNMSIEDDVNNNGLETDNLDIDEFNLTDPYSDQGGIPSDICDLPKLEINDNSYLDGEYTTGTHDKSTINFGNSYDDRTVSFINDCEVNGVSLPTSVTHYGNEIDRSVSGGLTSIDKSIIGRELDDQHSSGNISDCTYNSLKSKLSSC